MGTPPQQGRCAKAEPIVESKAGATRQDQYGGRDGSRFAFWTAACYLDSLLVPSDIHGLCIDEQGSARVAGPPRQLSIEFGPIHDEGQGIAPLVRDGDSAGGMDGDCVHGPDNNFLRKIEGLKGLGPDDSGAIYRLTDDRVLFENCDIETGCGQPLRSRAPSGSSPDHQDVVGWFHTVEAPNAIPQALP